jgi:pheromone receptor transcription factor
MHATDMSAIAGNSPSSQRKQSNASGHSVDLSEQSTPRGTKRENEDDDDDSAEDEPGSKNEKRAGRRKIKIEYIDDKSRRHITFSKRKAGIMKKVKIYLFIYLKKKKIFFKKKRNSFSE